jgi:hypothetical protein
MMFVVLFGAVLGVAWRRVSSALRIEQVAEIRRACDQGSIQALALAIEMLETRLRNVGGELKFDLSAPGDALPHTYNTTWQWKWHSPDSRWCIIGYNYSLVTNRWTINITSQKEEPVGLDLLPYPPAVP